MALAEGDSIAYLAARHLQAPEHGARLGAIGHGPDGASLAERLCHHLSTWGADRAAKPSITIYPLESAPRAAGSQIIKREHCEMTVVYYTMQSRASIHSHPTGSTVDTQGLTAQVEPRRGQPAPPGTVGHRSDSAAAATLIARCWPSSVTLGALPEAAGIGLPAEAAQPGATTVQTRCSAPPNTPTRSPRIDR
jgi:hypothetical protein